MMKPVNVKNTEALAEVRIGFERRLCTMWRIRMERMRQEWAFAVSQAERGEIDRSSLSRRHGTQCSDELAEWIGGAANLAALIDPELADDLFWLVEHVRVIQHIEFPRLSWESESTHTILRRSRSPFSR